MNMKFYRKLPIPKEIKEQFPASEEIIQTRNARVKELKDIISGADDRFILVIGPCSADNEDSVLDYIYRLRGVQEKVKDKIVIIPRIYTNKPRSKVRATHLLTQFCADMLTSRASHIPIIILRPFTHSTRHTGKAELKIPPLSSIQTTQTRERNILSR